MKMYITGVLNSEFIYDISCTCRSKYHDKNKVAKMPCICVTIKTNYVRIV